MMQRARSGRCIVATLGCSNDSQDHTVLPYAAIRLRQEASPDLGAVRSTRLAASSRGSAQSSARPAHHIRAGAAASTAPRPSFVTTYDRPSSWVGMAHEYHSFVFR